MGIHRKTFIQLLLALLIGLTGVIGTLQLLSEEAGAGPVVQEQASLPISRIENIAPVQVEAQVEVSTLDLTEDDDPDMEVTKSASADPVTAGEALTYTLTITNNGPYSGTGVLVTDTLPTGVTFVTAAASQGDCDESGGTVTCSLNSMVVSDTATVTVVVTVDSSTRGTLTNVARVSANEPDEIPNNNTYTETIAVNAESDLSLTKTDGSDPAIVGEVLIYTLASTNNGPSDATDVTLVDTLPSALTFISATFSQGACDESGGTVTCTLGTLANSATTTGTIAVTVTSSPPSGVVVTNTAVLDSQESTPLSVTETTVISSHGASVYVVLTPSIATISIGQSIPYTLTAYDAYDNSWDVTTGQTSFSILEAGHGGYWTDNVYHASNRGDWTVQAAYTETGVMTDTAALTVLAPVLHLDKSDTPDSVDAGEYLTYTLTYSNTGDAKATGAIITDTLDPNVSYVTATLPPTGGLPDAPFWSIGDVMTDELSQIHVTVSVARPLTNGTMLTNTAWLDAIQTTPLSATEETIVCSSPVLTITKTDNPDPVNAGNALGYTLIITNSGNENATSVVVTEHYDPNVSFFSHDRPDLYSGDGVWTIPVLTVDHAESINIIVEVTDTLSVGTVLTNLVTLDSDQTAPVTVTELTAVTSVSELTVSKDDLSDPVQAGEDFEYIINYHSSGTAPANGVVITETYDSRVIFVEASQSPRTGTDNVWDIGDLSVNQGGYIIVTVRVDTPLASGTVLTNLATIDSDHTSPQIVTETTTVSSTTSLDFSVTDYPDPVEPGDPLVYTLAYTNTGNADATQVVVTATLDANTSYFDASPTPTGGADDVWYWEIDSISGSDGSGGFGYGEIVLYTSVTLPLTNGTSLDFAAQLADAEGDLVPITAQTAVTSSVVLSLHKSDGAYTVYAGDRLTYTLTYTNSGKENAYDVIITDTLPSYVEYVDCEIQDGDCQYVQPDEVIFHISPLIAQTSGQAQLVVQVNDPLSAGANFVINHARMTHSSLAVPIDVQDVDPVGTKPDLTITGDHTPAFFSPGKLMTYTVIYGNTGKRDAEEVVITTILPSDTIYRGYGWSSSDGQTYTYQVGDLPAGSTGYMVTFTVAYPDQPEIGEPGFNTPFTIVAGGSAGGDANPGDNTAYVYIGVPDLVVTDFTVEPWPLKPDAPITFTVVLMNQGTTWAWNPDVQGGFWVDVFIAPVASYPFERYGEFYAGVPPIAPGLQHTLVITHSGFSEGEIQGEIEAFYAKVDNYAEPILDGEGRVTGWTRLYGLVPEYNEMNNIGGPIELWSHRVYLPMIVK